MDFELSQGIKRTPGQDGLKQMHQYFDAENLLSPPVKRAAYSDRTAWLMAEMALLAYEQFEGSLSLKDLAGKLVEQNKDEGKIKSLLERYLTDKTSSADEAKVSLEEKLKLANFSLVNIYVEKDTQAFLAKLEDAGASESMLVLAFRGTEPNVADIKTDLKASLKVVTGEQRVHKGFQEAFDAVRDEIESDLKKHPGVPVYITGHSLGGALAILATRFLASDSLGACYTFGSPRVGNSHFANSIKTPIYRIVNAADIVPRVPPAWFFGVLIPVIRWLPLPTEIFAQFLTRYRGYVHYGDMRYLNHVADQADAKGIPYEGLALLSNPALPYRVWWLFRRWIATWGKAAADDHSSVTYSEKLKAYARRRN